MGMDAELDAEGTEAAITLMSEIGSPPRGCFADSAGDLTDVHGMRDVVEASPFADKVERLHDQGLDAAGVGLSQLSQFSQVTAASDFAPLQGSSQASQETSMVPATHGQGEERDGLASSEEAAVDMSPGMGLSQTTLQSITSTDFEDIQTQSQGGRANEVKPAATAAV